MEVEVFNQLKPFSDIDIEHCWHESNTGTCGHRIPVSGWVSECHFHDALSVQFCIGFVDNSADGKLVACLTSIMNVLRPFVDARDFPNKAEQLKPFLRDTWEPI